MFLTVVPLFLTGSLAAAIGLAKMMHRMSGELQPGDVVNLGAAPVDPG